MPDADHAMPTGTTDPESAEMLELADAAGTSRDAADPGPTDGDRNTADHPPEIEGGQPAVGDDRPRNTEF